MATISDEEAQKLVIGVLYEVGWRREDITSILQGPYKFYEHLRRVNGGVVLPNRKRALDKGAFDENNLHAETADIHRRGIGTITEALDDDDEEG